VNCGKTNGKSTTISGLLLVVLLTRRSDLDLLLDLGEVDVSHGVLAVEDLGDLFEGGALGLDEDEVDPDELDEIPELEGIISIYAYTN
jgi:hypothetical protein